MNLQLDRDLCFLDLETTGGDVIKDRIVQIAIIKYPKDGGEPIERCYLVNPQRPMNPDALHIHGISNEMVKDEPTFKMLAVELYDFIGDSDIGGYNSNRFDIPLLIEEFARVGLEWNMENRRLVDCLQIFYKMEPRTLKAALKFYCQEELDGAHDALADTRATAKVFFGQMKYYDGVDYKDADDNITETPLNKGIQGVHDFVNDGKRVDFTGRFSRNIDGDIVFNFGQHKGQPAKNYPQFLNWIIQKDFPLQVKNIAKAILKGKLK